MTDNDYLFYKPSWFPYCSWDSYICKVSLDSEVFYVTGMVADYNASGATTTHGIKFYDNGSYLRAYIDLQNLTLNPYNNVSFRGMCYHKDPKTA